MLGRCYTQSSSRCYGLVQLFVTWQISNPSILLCCPPTVSVVPIYFFPWTIPYRTLLDSPFDLVTWPYHLSFFLFTAVNRSTNGPICSLILLCTSLLVRYSVYDISKSHLLHLISTAVIFLCSSTVREYVAQAYRNIEHTSACWSLILYFIDMFLSFQICLSCASADVAWAALERISVCDPSSLIMDPRYLNCLRFPTYVPVLLCQKHHCHH